MQLLTIGAFARAARLTPKALRLYDEVGLLPPAAVDPESGYRLYDPAQVEHARLIASLRRIGMPLAEIRTVCDLDPAAAASTIDAYWRRVTADNASRARQVDLLVGQLSRRNPMSDTLSVRFASRCDAGLGRDTNEDAAYAGERLWAVADGMRGAAGADASATAVAALQRLELSTSPAAELLTQLAAAVDEADRAIRGDHALGTTLTALLRRGSQLALIHVGDTRAYLLRNGALSLLTQDHTWVRDQVDNGKLTPAEAAAHPQRPLLTRALGAGPQPIEADLALRTALPGDRYLLCSDGLWATISRDALLNALTEAAEPADAADRLVELARAAGAPDNIACVVADFRS